ncbi:MAG: Rne/Rng family ribonuclease [Acidobacteria bacterium]|nr:Rne/Rng family ribonuclease [Acidobacteriota bacterium]
MSKEIIVSSTSHETKVAILDEDLLTELYYERESEYTLAGSIYKGRVTRVLPGMQSAFVDIGLERDAFLYVSDFLEDQEEYDKIASTVEEKVIRMQENPAAAELAPAPAAEPVPAPMEIAAESQTPEVPAATPQPEEKPPAARPFERGPQGGEHGRFSRRSRRRRGHHKDGFPESKYASRTQGSPPPMTPEVTPTSSTAPEPPIILPGESLAKYKERAAPESPSADEVSHKAEQVTPESNGESSSKRSVVDSAAGSAEESEVAPESIHGPELSSTETLAEERIEPRRYKENLISDVSEPSEPIDYPEDNTVTASREPQHRFEDQEPQDARQVSSPETAFIAAEPPAQAPHLESDSEQPYPASEMSDISVGNAAALAESAEAAEAAATAAIGETPESSISPAEESDETTAVQGAGEEPLEPGAPAQAAAADGETAQQASVRDRHRNPRYMRKGRWAARKEPRPDQASRGPRPRERETQHPLIADLLKEGQEIIVQIAKEPLGKKGARITSHIALPGRYLVYMPTVDHIGVSRKIASDEERQRLKRIILEHSRNIPGGFIVRTAGEGRSEEDLRQDLLFLSRLWADIKTQAEKAPAPSLLHHDLNLVLRTLRDQLSPDFSSVWVDNEQEYERVVSLVSKFQPALVNRVKLYTKDVPIFDEMGIQEEINKALKPKVWLKSGGYIVINQTEALVAIDVNTGKFVGKSNRLEDTIVKTNVEAIREIVRQIRLRDLGGIIVIDFIDMDERKNRQKVMAAMEEALQNDRSPSKILAFNEFGLVAITRKRVKQSLERTLCQPCSYCSGSGLVKSIVTVCNEILSEARKIAPQIERKQITLRVNPEVGRALKMRDNTILQEIEEMTGRPVIIRNDPMLHVEHFDFN